MSRWLVLIGLVVPAVVCFAGDARDPLAPGNNLPGTFHPFNVNEAVPRDDEIPVAKDKKASKIKVEPHSTKNKFHCLISEYDLDPTVMLIARGGEDNPGLQKLLRDLDSAIDRNRKLVRLHAFVVFTYDDLTDLLEQDAKREEHAKKLEKVAEDLKLRNVILALASKADLAKYRLADDAALTAILYRKLKIEASHKLPADKLADDAASKAILADVAGKLGAKK